MCMCEGRWGRGGGLPLHSGRTGGIKLSCSTVTKPRGWSLYWFGWWKEKRESGGGGLCDHLLLRLFFCSSRGFSSGLIQPAVEGATGRFGGVERFKAKLNPSNPEGFYYAQELPEPFNSVRGTRTSPDFCSSVLLLRLKTFKECSIVY